MDKKKQPDRSRRQKKDSTVKTGDGNPTADGSKSRTRKRKGTAKAEEHRAKATKRRAPHPRLPAAKPTPRRNPAEEAMADSEMRRTTAYHEAAHTVAGYVLDLAFGDTAIIPSASGHALGSSSVDNPLIGWRQGDGSRKSFLEKYVLVLYSGVAAEHLLNGTDIVYMHYGQDFDTARSWISETIRIRGCSYVGDEFFEAYENRLMKQAKTLMQQHWDKVEIVARMLLAKGTVSHDDVCSALDPG